ncbi:MAG TPA: M10 family metallopeptidase C-terminal domain-containing protein [Arsenophonus apicola]
MFAYNKEANLTNLMLDHDGDGQMDFKIEITGEVKFAEDILI